MKANGARFRLKASEQRKAAKIFQNKASIHFNIPQGWWCSWLTKWIGCVQVLWLFWAVLQGTFALTCSTLVTRVSCRLFKYNEYIGLWCMVLYQHNLL